MIAEIDILCHGKQARQHRKSRKNVSGRAPRKTEARGKERKKERRKEQSNNQTDKKEGKSRERGKMDMRERQKGHTVWRWKGEMQQGTGEMLMWMLRPFKMKKTPACPAHGMPALHNHSLQVDMPVLYSHSLQEGMHAVQWPQNPMVTFRQ